MVGAASVSNTVSTGRWHSIFGTLKGAYTSAMAMFREFDWSRTEHTSDLSRLAVLDAATFARVRFELPPGTRFRSLPVDAGDYGLVFPPAGESCATGPELVVALGQGAKIDVIEGVYVRWLDPDGPRPCARVCKGHQSGTRQAPEGFAVGASGERSRQQRLGQAAQAVARHKSEPRAKRVFDTRQGEMMNLPENKITQPVVAALTTGLIRAAVSDNLARLPPHVIVFTATTDGFLSGATEAEVRAVASGPVATYFASLRAMVDPKGDASILEMKHSADALLVCKTRGSGRGVILT